MKRRSKEEGLALVEKYQASGLTQERFATKARINVAVLRYWLRRSRELEAGAEPVRFVELTSGVGPGDDVGARFETPDGLAVIFEQVPTPEYLVDLIRGI